MLSHYLEQQLKEAELNLDEYRAVLQRLLDYGVICRDESMTEQQLYDLYLRMQAWIDDYLQLVGIRVQHDRRFHYVRLFPPASQVPGMVDEDQTFSGFRARPSQQEVTLLLVLRSLYEQSIREGRVDASGGAAVSMESISISLKNLLGRTLPAGQTERRQLFRRLKQLRVLQFGQDEELDQGESWLTIRPLITSLVHQDVLDAVLAGDESDESEQVSVETASVVESEPEPVVDHVVESVVKSAVEEVCAPVAEEDSSPVVVTEEEAEDAIVPPKPHASEQPTSSIFAIE